MTRLLILGGSDAGISAALRARELNALDLSYTPPISSPWDPVQLSSQAWVKQYHQGE